MSSLSKICLGRLTFSLHGTVPHPPGSLPPKNFRHARITLFWETAVQRNSRAHYLMFTSKRIICNKSVYQMGRKRVHGSQFSRRNQPSVKRKRKKQLQAVSECKRIIFRVMKRSTNSRESVNVCSLKTPV